MKTVFAFAFVALSPVVAQAGGTYTWMACSLRQDSNVQVAERSLGKLLEAEALGTATELQTDFARIAKLEQPQQKIAGYMAWVGGDETKVVAFLGARKEERASYVAAFDRQFKVGTEEAQVIVETLRQSLLGDLH